ncbi:DUF1499 domain-containing protein [Malonomonas rubra]|uniref:DUF1499 domain-containing protein n=1 Tax=Malonomonas rubra TaxID=57040 RepID=UPI0026E99281|nr:DUF1499 domain-containing protein [Malonomonas rubra]
MKILLLLAVLSCFALIPSGCRGAKKVEHLGLVEGQLRPCPDSPNCVSSESSDAGQKIDPFLLQVSPEKAWATIKKTVPTLTRTQIVLETDTYLRAECRSAVFGFVDDLAPSIARCRGGTLKQRKPSPKALEKAKP